MGKSNETLDRAMCTSLLEHIENLIARLKSAQLLGKVPIAQDLAEIKFQILAIICSRQDAFSSRLEALENPQTERNDEDGEKTGTTMR